MRIADDNPRAELAAFRTGFFSKAAPSSYELTRFVFLRGLGLIYLVAFGSLAIQLAPLLGSEGLLPVSFYLDDVWNGAGGAWALVENPTIFFLAHGDGVLHFAALTGVVLALSVLAGFANVPILFALATLELSFVHVGQIFWGYGWELMLLEAGYLAIFAPPLLRPSPFGPAPPTPVPVVWMLRWLLFRVMFGAGLIKLRGDPCWVELTCLDFHYETQPVPSPLTPLFHFAPTWVHHTGVVVNHVVELVVPWFVFGPRRARHVAGIVLVLFQVMLILSGNLSFLNWLTLVLCIACFDDAFLARVLPRRLCERIGAPDDPMALPRGRRLAVFGYAIVVAVLSVSPILNMLSPGQLMNASFDPFHLVNTYGAFGSVSRERHEVILLGTRAERPDAPDAVWKEYEFLCKPGDPDRRPCLITPYHYRLDWQLWFAALGDYEREPWLVHMVDKLLRGESTVKRLLARDPFPDAPPRFIRADLYRYELAPLGARAWWRRTYVGPYLVRLSRDHPGLASFLERHGFRR